MTDAGKGRQRGGAGGGKRKTTKRVTKPSKARRRRVERGRRRANLIWAIAHRLRRQILRAIADSGEACSPTWLADALDLPLSTAAYHVTILRRFEAVELADEQMARGAIEHFYLSTIKNDPPIEALLAETREADREDLQGAGS